MFYSRIVGIFVFCPVFSSINVNGTV